MPAYILVYYKGYWCWYIAFIITRFLDFAQILMFCNRVPGWILFVFMYLFFSPFLSLFRAFIHSLLIFIVNFQIISNWQNLISVA
jgi:hypothetical protein